MNRSDQRFILAVDVGQSHDYTALVVINSYQEHQGHPDAWSARKAARRHDIVHLERFRELSYPQQARRVEERYRELKQHAQRFDLDATLSLVVDATGVGKPILDTFRETGLRPRGVIITGGDSSSRVDGLDRVPKRELVTTLQVALQAGRLRIAEDLPLAEALLKELRGFRVKVTLTGAKFGNDVGSWREADHDDLVLATALGVWMLENRRVTSRAMARKIAGLL